MIRYSKKITKGIDCPSCKLWVCENTILFERGCPRCRYEDWGREEPKPVKKKKVAGKPYKVTTFTNFSPTASLKPVRIKKYVPKKMSSHKSIMKLHF